MRDLRHAIYLVIVPYIFISIVIQNRRWWSRRLHKTNTTFRGLRKVTIRNLIFKTYSEEKLQVKLRESANAAHARTTNHFQKCEGSIGECMLSLLKLFCTEMEFSLINLSHFFNQIRNIRKRAKFKLLMEHHKAIADTNFRTDKKN